MSWGVEISLDVEWAHALAPRANLLLVEANDNSGNNLFAAANYGSSGKTSTTAFSPPRRATRG
jgi:subtilase family serine protease